MYSLLGQQKQGIHSCYQAQVSQPINKNNIKPTEYNGTTSENVVNKLKIEWISIKVYFEI
jgi:hypothetical protein